MPQRLEQYASTCMYFKDVLKQGSTGQHKCITLKTAQNCQRLFFFNRHYNFL